MSTPTTRQFPSGSAQGHEVARFVAAVRAELDDLSPDEVTELTGGLEADLTDALGESGQSSSQISSLYGDPVDYATELRAAAGLPVRGGARSRHRLRPNLAHSLERDVVLLRSMRDDGLAYLERQAWWHAVREFLLVVRPAWWVIRAWVAVQCLLMLADGGDNAAVRGGVGGLILLLVAIVLSVQLGRRSPFARTSFNQLVVAGNVIAALLLLPVVFADSPAADAYTTDESRPPGLYNGENPISNVFPYDADGHPLTGVQLFDQDGQPLEVNSDNRTGYDETSQKSVTLVPGSAPGSAPRWNAFPMQQRVNNDETGELGPVQPAPLPLSRVTTATPSPSPSVSASISPSISASVAPSVSASTGPPSLSPSESPTPKSTR